MIGATDISLVFLGILIVMVLLEVRKLSRRREPSSRLEETVERLSRQMERIGAPPDVQLPGGARIVEAGQNFETISEQLERLGESAVALDQAMGDEEAVKRFRDGIQQLRADLRAAHQLFERAAAGMGQTSDAILAAGSAIQRIEARMESMIGSRPAPERQAGD